MTGMTHEIRCSTEDSTGSVFKDLRKEGRPGETVTVCEGMTESV